jgi:pyruvate/2-oxoglutarate dehydrogenase complex dihydrolipoamide dehydrogenase (E3) component
MFEELVIIGGGPAGIEAAREAAKSDLNVTLVSAGKIGGRAGWHSLLPSKVWLAAAESAQELAGKTGGASSFWEPASIVARIAQVKEAWNGATEAELIDAGVQVVYGMASFVSPEEVVVKDGENNVSASYSGAPIIIATGSVPFFPPGLKPDGRRVIAPRLLSKLSKLSSSMLVVGAGATGCEAAYLFNALGVDVTWIVDQYGILPLFQEQAGEALGDALSEQGVSIVAGQMVETLERGEDSVKAVLMDGERIEAEMAFVAVGRRPDWSALDLAAAGLEPDAGGRIAVDAYGRSVNPLVYFAGDSDGGIMTANKAHAQGRIAARSIAGLDVDPFMTKTLVQPVYTSPQVAQVGDMDAAEGLSFTRVHFKETLKSYLLQEGDGFLDLAYREADGRVLGAVAVGAHAADILSPVAAAIKLEGNIEDMAALFAGYPSLSELSFIAARGASRSARELQPDS